MILFQAPSTNYSAQRREFESMIDPSFSRMRITITRENWPGADLQPIGTIELFVSADGVTYPPIPNCSVQLLGGFWAARDGSNVSSQFVECGPLPAIGTNGRKVKAVCDNTQPLRTTITVEAF